MRGCQSALAAVTLQSETASAKKQRPFRMGASLSRLNDDVEARFRFEWFTGLHRLLAGLAKREGLSVVPESIYAFRLQSARQGSDLAGFHVAMPRMSTELR